MANQKLTAGRRIFESTGFGRCLSRKAGYLAGELLSLELATVRHVSAFSMKAFKTRCHIACLRLFCKGKACKFGNVMLQ